MKGLIYDRLAVAQFLIWHSHPFGNILDEDVERWERRNGSAKKWKVWHLREVSHTNQMPEGTRQVVFWTLTLPLTLLPHLDQEARGTGLLNQPETSSHSRKRWHDLNSLHCKSDFKKSFCQHFDISIDSFSNHPRRVHPHEISTLDSNPRARMP